MKFKKFTFSEMDPLYGGEITFATKDSSINIKVRFPDCTLINLVQGILSSWKDEKQLVQVHFEEEMAWYDLMLINYPYDVLKIEIYKDVLWDFFDEVNYTISNPIYSEYTDHHSFSFLITQEMKRHGAAFFKNPKWPYPELTMKELYRMMVGG